jgi:RHH-type proline utilization regulon transcriptional repressor/proline dehydrogenase/delta 1-pyrroline-5-carboxylate dehydrogenase
VHLGIASHNLFDVAHGIVLREERGVEAWVEFEMLEGMANHQARVVQERAGGLLLYAPVVRAEDFHSAIAYLVRRLDENTAPDNFLRHVFGLEPGSPEWDLERDRFLAAFELVDDLPDAPRRTQDRAAEAAGAQAAGDLSAPFVNEPDTDWAVAANRDWIDRVRAEWRARPPSSVPLQIGGELVAGAVEVEARDRSHPARVAYRHVLADRRQVSRALDAARAAQAAWAARPAAERRGLIDGAAAALARRRGDLIGAMIVDGAKTVTEADPEVSEAIDFARYYARALGAGDTVDGCRLEPLGVVVVAPPWNFPLSIPAGGVLAALAAGNAVLLKPALEAVLVGWHLAGALWEAGIPREALQLVPCPDDEVGRGLITDPRVDAVILTGSVETARRFLEWRPDLRLLAETSGKNAIVVTSLADRDQAVRDLVRSAFGHDGQKCSAASLAICLAEVYDDPAFRRQLRDAAASLAVGSAWDVASRVTPLTQPPGSALRRALTSLDPGEEWLLEPRSLSREAPLWSPGIKLGVRRGSFFHQTECFGPVLGLMRAADLDEAIELVNDQPFGLTSGIQSLDDREVARWLDRIEAGNLYVNRHITGAIVGRQPFGGWKASSVGPGAKAGGPNYVLQLCRARQIERPLDGAPPSAAVEAWLERCVEAFPDAESRAILRGSAASYALAWREHFGRGHEPIHLLGERNVFRYRPCRRVLVRAETATLPGRIALAQVLLAARTCGVPAEVSLAAGEPEPWLVEEGGRPAVVEREADLIGRLVSAGAERLRVLAPMALEARAAAHAAGVIVLDGPVLATGCLELRAYLREQAISRTVHRYGTVMEPAPGEAR